MSINDTVSTARGDEEMTVKGEQSAVLSLGIIPKLTWED
jgi:hypothetical protein